MKNGAYLLWGTSVTHLLGGFPRSHSQNDMMLLASFQNWWFKIVARMKKELSGSKTNQLTTRVTLIFEVFSSRIWWCTPKIPATWKIPGRRLACSHWASKQKLSYGKLAQSVKHCSHGQENLRAVLRTSVGTWTSWSGKVKTAASQKLRVNLVDQQGLCWWDPEILSQK